MNVRSFSISEKLLISTFGLIASKFLELRVSLKKISMTKKYRLPILPIKIKTVGQPAFQTGCYIDRFFSIISGFNFTEPARVANERVAKLPNHISTCAWQKCSPRFESRMGGLHRIVNIFGITARDARPDFALGRIKAVEPGSRCRFMPFVARIIVIGLQSSHSESSRTVMSVGLSAASAV